MRSIIFAGAMVAATTGMAQSQSAPQAPAAPAANLAVSVQPVLMAVVGDGIFVLKEGSSLDLTKNEILMTMPRGQNKDGLERGTVELRISGHSLHMNLGGRHDLKTWSPTSKQVKDKDKCFLDLIDVVAPKGAASAATFRFSCT